MLEDLKAALDVWNALKHAPATDVLLAVGLHALYRAMKRLLSISWKPKPWTFIFFTNDLLFNAQYAPKDKHDPKGKRKTKKMRRAKNKAGRRALTTHPKTTPTLSSPRIPKSFPTDKSLPSDIDQT